MAIELASSLERTRNALEPRHRHPQWRPRGRYRIGWRVLELAEVRRRTLDVLGATRPALESLAATWREICHVAVRDHDHALYL